MSRGSRARAWQSGEVRVFHSFFAKVPVVPNFFFFLVGKKISLEFLLITPWAISFPSSLSILCLFRPLSVLPLGREGGPCWKVEGGQWGDLLEAGIKLHFLTQRNYLFSSILLFPSQISTLTSSPQSFTQGPSPFWGKFLGVGPWVNANFHVV